MMKARPAVVHLIARPYQATDFPTILGLVRARPTALARAYPSLADVEELLALPEIQSATQLWETPTGQAAGYALMNYADTYADLAFEYLPEFTDTGIGDEMLAWGEQFFRERYHGQAGELTTSAHDEQPERIGLLERHGYSRQPESVVELFRALDEPIPTPALPDGFAMRPLLGESEVSDWVALHRAAFGTQNMTVTTRLAMMRLPDYDPGLDLVVTGPEGGLAAYVLTGIHSQENALSGMQIGYPDLVGTLPRYQGCGLARALLLESLLRLKQRGMSAACLHTSSANLPMQKAAQAVGFILTGQSWHYSRTF